METADIVRHANALLVDAERISRADAFVEGLKARTVDFFSLTAGKRSAFTTEAATVSGSNRYQAERIKALLTSYREHVESGIGVSVSPQRQAELDVVSDFLEQAHALLENRKVHPAAPIVLIGATLEEFLRTWIEAESLSLGNRKPGLENYAQVLKEADLISKQDLKDLTAWGGLRNHAAHGEWEQVSDPKRATIMLDGVNLFMRQHSPE